MKGSSDSTWRDRIDELAADSYARYCAQLAAPDRRRSITAQCERPPCGPKAAFQKVLLLIASANRDGARRGRMMFEDATGLSQKRGVGAGNAFTHHTTR